MLSRIVTAAAIVALWTGAAAAQQFPTFSTDRFEGWVENTGSNDGQIVVYPAIIEPGAGAYWREPGALDGFQSVNPYAAPPAEGLDITSANQLKFSYRIIADARYLPDDLRRQISEQANIPIGLLQQYTLTFARAERFDAVELNIGGQTYRQDLGSSAIVGPYREGSFYLDGDDAALKNALREGDYQLTLIARMPVASYSSINLDLSATAITNSWIKAFREVSRRTRRSGFNAGFIDFSTTVQKVRVEEEIRSDTNTRIGSNTTIVMRAPTPAQLDRFEKLFGFVQQSQSEMLEAHRSGHAAALLAGALNLADAHDKYIKEIEANAPGNSDNILSALSKLKDDEALKFMTAGFRSSFGSTATSYKYSGASITNSTTSLKSEYNEFIIDNAFVETRTVNARRPDGGKLAYALAGVDARTHERIFGVGNLTSGMRPANARDWAAGVAGAIDRQHLGDIQYAFIDLLAGPVIDPVLTRFLADPNTPLDGNGDGLLHRAVRVGDDEVVKLLLRNGADPNRANRFGDTPRDLAEQLRRSQIAATLRDAESRSGESVWLISHPGVQISDLRFEYPSAPGEISVEPVDANSFRLRIRGYPHRAWARLTFTYRFSVPLHQAAAIQFPHEQRVVGNTYEARSQGHIFQPYRIRDGGSDAVSVRIVYGGPQFGFIQEGSLTP